MVKNIKHCKSYAILLQSKYKKIGVKSIELVSNAVHNFQHVLSGAVGAGLQDGNSLFYLQGVYTRSGWWIHPGLWDMTSYT